MALTWTPSYPTMSKLGMISQKSPGPRVQSPARLQDQLSPTSTHPWTLNSLMHRDLEHVFSQLLFSFARLKAKGEGGNRG